MAEEINSQELNRLYIVNKHLKELKDNSTDKDFGKIRLKHYHESLLLSYFYKAYKESKGSFHGFEPIKTSSIFHANENLTGIVLSFELDDLLSNLSNITCEQNVSLEELHDSFIFTPSLFVFLPDKELFTNANKLNNLFSGNLCMKGVSGKNFVILIEPFTAFKIGLGFLIEGLINDKNIHSLLVGFVFNK
ncbi:hypothetical protein TUBRATIS_004140 [Tubulinosema ratisbonensis]|uniref:Uncharacterized protein n=1 Tax=Tubulinosema ratisbonensis TaxID=291195 RepID=A0A437AP93_9MICR|nr:hypothetical protein TUBRATIS_004140 [Tubulinosema ratisbonensis]